MYDIKYDNLKKSFIGPAIVLIIGLTFLIIVISMNILEYYEMKSMDNSTLSTSYESAIDNNSDSDSVMYRGYYKYYVNDKEYICKSNMSSNIPVNSNKKIYYQTSNPSNCLVDDDDFGVIFNVIFIIVAAIILTIGLILLIIKLKKINKIKYLNNHGKLIKGIPYHMEETNISFNNRVLPKIVINVTLNGRNYTLSGDPRYDNKIGDNDNLVDLLIDESDTNNYFIDFEINRISGNLPTDYYNNMNNINNMNNMI